MEWYPKNKGLIWKYYLINNRRYLEFELWFDILFSVKFWLSGLLYIDLLRLVKT